MRNIKILALAAITLWVAACGNDKTNTPPSNAKLPTLTTTEVYNISTAEAAASAEITDPGDDAVSARGVCWSTRPNPTVADSKTESGSGTGIFSATMPSLAANTTYYVRAYATNSIGKTAYGNQITFSTIKPYMNPNLRYGNVMDIDGNSYATIAIGTPATNGRTAATQVWMAENLKTTHYNDGTPIPNAVSSNHLLSTGWWVAYTSGSGAWCYYDNDTTNNATYGKLYNWYAVNTGKLCPQGWHIPTDAEWTLLADDLGGEAVAGGKMKATGYWDWDDINSNESGFSGLPGGYRTKSGAFSALPFFALWWSVSENNATVAWGRSLFPFETMLLKDLILSNDNTFEKGNGLSCRCVQD
jgi:uncharacterized protein (TIGR02145 family)